jgi:hypothetical protein
MSLFASELDMVVDDGGCDDCKCWNGTGIGGRHDEEAYVSAT